MPGKDKSGRRVRRAPQPEEMAMTPVGTVGKREKPVGKAKTVASSNDLPAELAMKSKDHGLGFDRPETRFRDTPACFRVLEDLQ